jgi:dTDP-4-dehydrorhamnose reductase
MERRFASLPAPEVWAGFESARVRVRRSTVDQLRLTGHTGRPDDIDLLSWLGVTAVRYPVAWDRVAPRGLAVADWSWTDARLAALAERSVEPLAGLLHHGGGPRGMSILHPHFPAALATFARAVANRYPWIQTYIPINEPLTTARFAGLYGLWHPHARSDIVFGRLVLAQCLAIRAAADAIRSVRGDVTIIVSEDVGRTFSTPRLASTADSANERRWLSWDLLGGRVDEAHPMWPLLASSPAAVRDLHSLIERPSPPDVLGIDHYVTSDRYLDERVDTFPEAVRPQSYQPRYVDVDAVRVAGLPGDSLARAIDDTWDRFGRPVALTEVSLAGSAHDQVAWWSDAWTAACVARARGIDVRAVTAWAVVGATDWDSLLCRSAGRYEPGLFDIRDRPPTPRPVAHAVRAAALAASSARTMRSQRSPLPGHPEGWWRRADRYLYAAR